MIRSIGVIGCGWLGFPLAKQLMQAGFIVTGTARQPDRIEALNHAGIPSTVVSVSEDGTLSYTDTRPFESDLIIITLPFKRSFNDPTCYLLQIKAITEQFISSSSSSSKWVIFTSSTSIYPLLNKDVTEALPLVNLTPRQQALFNTEQYMLNHPQVDATILRCGGLFGYSRRIGNFYRSKPLADPDSPVNLIHQDDVIGIIMAIITTNTRRTILNGVTPHHPTKKELYTTHRPAHHGPLAIAPSSNKQLFKRVCSEKCSSLLNYSFKYTNLFSDYD